MIQLSDKEQAVLNAACVRIEKATQEAQAMQRAAEQAARKADSLAQQAQGVFRSIMDLSGRNPDAHQVNWDGKNATVEELPKPEAPAEEPSNVVPLPAAAAEEPATSGNA